jgi:UPF0716 family protein affecting phage T7 exclusion
MLITRYIFKFLTIFLALLGAIPGIVQVALGLMVIYNQFRELLKLDFAWQPRFHSTKMESMSGK